MISFKKENRKAVGKTLGHFRPECLKKFVVKMMYKNLTSVSIIYLS